MQSRVKNGIEEQVIIEIISSIVNNPHSYHNLPTCISECNIIETHIWQHAVLVGIMICREFNREG